MVKMIKERRILKKKILFHSSWNLIKKKPKKVGGKGEGGAGKGGIIEAHIKK